MIVFLTEEQSMSSVIKKVMTELCPYASEGFHWQIISHQGKADLETNLVRKMTTWNYNSPHFIILRDNDGGNCRTLKNRILELAAKTNKPHHVRLVCQELEAWFLGDLVAVERAYPDSNASSYATRNPYRTPDHPTNASQLLEELTQTSAKVGRANQIAQFLDLNANTSHSFNVFISTLKTLLPDHTPISPHV